MMDWITSNSGMVVTLGLSGSFFLILLWAYMPRKKNNLQDQAMIPFKEESR